ncbi:unnamed protein product [Rotaria socialis]|uniref:Cadherin domain-containing protein n=1 Tax=Rotaria socialis TaxID=392032 RepID=A0A820BEP4_9BILA|nr:unnamed protein product [Rotaria socialis]CAF3378867.1 unnamed protein product [Rotaria socialis]CAF3547915.1 unnamed protein product [Rotaria socialis]CAF4179013.1 unnamed protein product [Rotaria socialis]CAF4200203.1 unnamed protein product [Rotaria socialis]
MHYYFYLLLIPIIYANDCEEICNITLSVMENTPTERLQWNLMDLIYNRTLSFENFQFSLSNPSDYFEIESKILKFRLTELDRETICKKSFLNDECSLQLQIFTQTSFLIIFKMIILDENDWKPFFNQDYIHLNIRENLSTYHRIQLPSAYDDDSIQYDIDYYEIFNNTDEIENIFQLERSHDELKLKLLKKLNCELKNNYQLYIIAIDKGGLKSNILHVNITVGDLNEYQPRFSQRFYHKRIPENIPITNSSSSSILQIIATDDDCSDETILYSIQNNDIPKDLFPFEIDKYTGLIRVKQQLDYETMQTYRFRVRASNLDGITSSMVPIIIDILDINDNRPSIQINILNEYKFKENNDNFFIHINENIRLGQVIGTILIRDVDSTMTNHHLSLKILSCLPSTLSCPIELDSGMKNSSLSSTTYLIRTSRLLDREIGDENFMIMLEARDYGNPSLNSQRHFVVNIDDENDCAPKFTQLNYQFRLPNLSPSGFFIGQIHAYDNDYSPNFRLVKYQFLEDDFQDIINIDVNNGSLFLVTPLLTEMTLNITVRATDQLNNSLYDQANIQIQLLDGTKCLPIFRQAVYVFNTTEHQIIPYEIGRVNIDSCLMASITINYHLANENLLSTFPFSMDTHTGIIKVIRELDREIRSFYKFRIRSFHSKTQESSEAEIHINILDDNDHYPVFDHVHEEYVYISTHHQQTNRIFISHIHATDADVDLNGVVNYYFTNKNHYEHFHLYPNGSIVLYNLNDIHLPIRLEIYARDQGYPRPLNSKESIFIYVCDIFKRNECPKNQLPNKLRKNIYIGSLFIMISIVFTLFILIVCVLWNLFLKKNFKKEEKNNSCSYQIEARKNLIISDSLHDLSPIIRGNRRLKCVVV